eukprot:761870-Hanusia_phi.AAC.1
MRQRQAEAWEAEGSKRPDRQGDWSLDEGVCFLQGANVRRRSSQSLWMKFLMSSSCRAERSALVLINGRSSSFEQYEGISGIRGLPTGRSRGKLARARHCTGCSTVT